MRPGADIAGPIQSISYNLLRRSIMDTFETSESSSSTQSDDRTVLPTLYVDLELVNTVLSPNKPVVNSQSKWQRSEQKEPTRCDRLRSRLDRRCCRVKAADSKLKDQAVCF